MMLQAYVKAKECSQIVSVEEFAIILAKHFTSYYQQVTTAIIKIVEKPWERINIDGQPHNHGYKLGSERHTTEVILNKNGTLRVTSGVEGLALLKTTQSGFEGFIRDQNTILPETRKRMLATEVSASWRYHFESLPSIINQSLGFTEKYLDVKKVLVDTFFGPPKEGVYSPSGQATLYYMAKAVLGCHKLEAIHFDLHIMSQVSRDIKDPVEMPNIHFLPVNLSSKANPLIVKFEDDVYLPTDEPHGSIEASLSRVQSKM